MTEHSVDGVEVLFAFIVEVLGLGFELLKPPLRVNIDRIFCVLADVELGLELLRCLWSWERNESETYSVFASSRSIA